MEHLTKMATLMCSHHRSELFHESYFIPGTRYVVLSSWACTSSLKNMSKLVLQGVVPGVHRRAVVVTNIVVLGSLTFMR